MQTLNVPTNEPALFKKAVKILQDFHSECGKNRLLTSNFAVAIAALMHRDAGCRGETAPPVLIHYPGSGAPVTTLGFQTKICDPIFTRKPEFLPEGYSGPIYKPFTNSFKGRSPRVNNWRNSFDLQGGLGCDAPYTRDFLLKESYLDEQRFHCKYRDSEDGTCRSPAGLTESDHRTCFNPNKRSPVPGPKTNAQHRPKLFTRGYDPNNQSGFWIIEPSIEVLTELVGGPLSRVPVYPFMGALYGGNKYLDALGSEVNIDRLQSDLQLDDAKFFTLFDVSDSKYNIDFLKEIHSEAEAEFRRFLPPASMPGGSGRDDQPDELLSKPQKRMCRQPRFLKYAAGASSDPARRAVLIEKATQLHEETVQLLANQLAELGYEALEQLDGFDLYAESPECGFLFEVKTLTKENFRHQVRMGVAQLLEYQWRNKDWLRDPIEKFLVFNCAPPEHEESWIWRFLHKSLAITPCWIEGGRVKSFPGLKSSLTFIP